MVFQTFLLNGFTVLDDDDIANLIDITYIVDVIKKQIRKNVGKQMSQQQLRNYIHVVQLMSTGAGGWSLEFEDCLGQQLHKGFQKINFKEYLYD